MIPFKVKRSGYEDFTSWLHDGMIKVEGVSTDGLATEAGGAGRFASASVSDERKAGSNYRCASRST